MLIRFQLQFGQTETTIPIEMDNKINDLRLDGDRIVFFKGDSFSEIPFEVA